jgi:hypothetical protein
MASSTASITPGCLASDCYSISKGFTAINVQDPSTNSPDAAVSILSFLEPVQKDVHQKTDNGSDHCSIGLPSETSTLGNESYPYDIDIADGISSECGTEIGSDITLETYPADHHHIDADDTADSIMSETEMEASDMPLRADATNSQQVDAESNADTAKSLVSESKWESEFDITVGAKVGGKEQVDASTNRVYDHSELQLLLDRQLGEERPSPSVAPTKAKDIVVIKGGRQASRKRGPQKTNMLMLTRILRVSKHQRTGPPPPRASAHYSFSAMATDLVCGPLCRTHSGLSQ